jgi:2-isopropylmalate synthase
VLKEYHVDAVTQDTDALGEVSVLVELDGRLASGQGVSTDTLEASARAYLRGVSNALAGVATGGGSVEAAETAEISADS